MFFEPLEDRNLLAVLTWDGGGGADNFSDAANWTNGSADQLPVSGDTLVFPSGFGTLSINNDFADGMSFALRFDDGNYTITGNSITLNSGISYGIQNNAGTNAVNTPLVLGSAPGNIIDIVSGSLTLGSAISGGAGNALVKTGAGLLTLGGSSSYTGGTTLSQGTLQSTSATGFGTGTVTLGDANTGANNIQLTLAATIANAIDVSSSGSVSIPYGHHRAEPHGHFASAREWHVGLVVRVRRWRNQRSGGLDHQRWRRRYFRICVGKSRCLGWYEFVPGGHRH
jgi:autotransporter-associated beta strand protein